MGLRYDLRAGQPVGPPLYREWTQFIPVTTPAQKAYVTALGLTDPFNFALMAFASGLTNTPITFSQRQSNQAEIDAYRREAWRKLMISLGRDPNTPYSP